MKINILVELQLANFSCKLPISFNIYILDVFIYNAYVWTITIPHHIVYFQIINLDWDKQLLNSVLSSARYTKLHKSIVTLMLLFLCAKWSF